MSQSPTKSTLKYKEVAVEFLRLTASGSVSEAYRKYTSPNFRHHNPFFRGDATSLMVAMEENAAQNPNKILEIQHALEDGDFVAIHSQVKMKPEDLGYALVHIFRFDGDFIVEMWDIVQAVLENSPNEHGMF